jgi:hypothetical protein
MKEGKCQSALSEENAYNCPQFITFDYPKKLMNTSKKTNIGENNEAQEILAPCINCKTETLHLIKADYCSNLIVTVPEKYGEERIYKLPTQRLHQVIECKGCLMASYREVTTYPSFDDYGVAIEGRSTIKISHYPLRNSENIVPKSFITLPTTLQIIYEEVVGAYNHQMYVLCAAGLRASVESICNDLQIKPGSLPKKIQVLYESGKLSKATSDSLKAHRFLGNNALHLIDRPSQDELRHAIDLLEHTLREIYEIPSLDKKLSDLITQRILMK